MNSKQKGFTLTELLIVIAVIVIIGIVLFLGAGIFTGNFWYTNKSVLREIRIDHPGATHILKTERKIWNYSEILVQENNERTTYYLDSDIFWNYEFHQK